MQLETRKHFGSERKCYASWSEPRRGRDPPVPVRPNAVPEAKPHLFLATAKTFWAPVPWMLHATIILELILGRLPEAIIIGFLLVFNAGLGFVQENRAQNSLALLRQRLPVKARVLREGQWQLLPAEDLVPGDFVQVRMGDIVPAGCAARRWTYPSRPIHRNGSIRTVVGTEKSLARRSNDARLYSLKESHLNGSFQARKPQAP